MPLTKALKMKLGKLKDSKSYKANCCICGKPLNPEADDTEYIKTKRATESFFHHDCMRRW